jgi:hypothetical protein
MLAARRVRPDVVLADSAVLLSRSRVFILDLPVSTLPALSVLHHFVPQMKFTAFRASICLRLSHQSINHHTALLDIPPSPQKL